MKELNRITLIFGVAAFLAFSLLIFPATVLAGVEITSPVDGETVGGEIPIAVSYWGTPLWPVYYVYTSVTGGYSIQPPALSGAHTFYWDTTPTPNGTQKTIQAYATWAGSSGGAYDTVTVTIYNPLPVITITSPTNGQIIPPDLSTLPVSVEFHNVPPNYHGIKWINLSIDGSPVGGLYVPGYPASGTYTWYINIANYSLGEHSLKAYCVDTSYKEAFSDVVRIIIGVPPPLIEPTKEIPQEKVTTVAEPINIANGNMFTSQTDMLIPAKEIPLELSRTYNSQDDFDGTFGYGWRSNFDISLTEQPDHSVMEVDEKGVYTIYTKNPNGTYKPSAGKYSQLSKNPDGTYTILRKHGQKLYFNPQGKLTKVEERNGNYLNILRTSGGTISQVSDSTGRKLLFTQNPKGKITQAKDPLDKVYKYEYDSAGNLIKTIDPLNNETLYKYDNNHNLTQQTDANNHSISFEYDSSDRAYHSWQDENNNAVTLSFNSDNKTTTSLDSLDNSTTYEYNKYGLVSKITDTQGNIQTFAWDNNLNKTSSTDRNSNTTTYTYDTRGNLTSVTDPLGNTTGFAYESDFDFVSSVTDALGNITEYRYDVKGNLLQVKDAVGNITNYYYNSLGQLTQLEDANNNVTGFNYDTYGNLTGITDALNNQTNFAYDIIGNVIQISDAKGNSTQFTYDLLNRLTKITYADNSKVNYVYDAVGNLISFIDPSDHATTYSYDVVNRLTQVVDALGKLTQYTYDTEGNRLNVIDANLNKTQYFYDNLNRLSKTLDPLNNPTLFNYDPNGSLISKTDAKVNTINYTYDTGNRLVQIKYPDVSVVSFSYDALGRRRAMTDSIGTTNYSYDALSRLTQIDGPSDNDTISYAYDKVSNRIQMTNQDAGKTNYLYDRLNRLLRLTDPQGKATTYAYDSLSNLTGVKYPNNTQANYTFDVLNRLISLSNKVDANAISSYIYQYEPSGMRTRVTLANNDYILYSYDEFNQLTQEKRYNPNGGLLYSLEFTYDSTGNRLTQKIDFKDNKDKKDNDLKIKGLPEEATLEYAYNPDNQLIQLKVYKTNKKAKVKLSKSIDYTYNQNGNLIQEITQDKDEQVKKTKTFAYDYENRLIQVKISEPDEPETKTFDFSYDGLGRRVSQTMSKIDEDESETKVRFYLYDGLNVIIERDAAKQTLATYNRGLSYGGGIGSIIDIKTRDEEDEEEQLYYHYDGLGNVTDLTNTHAKPKITYTYDAFGNILSQKGSRGINPYGFSTKEQDKSGLLYFGARYYEPTVGRFITQDPLGMVDGPNLYVYAKNNPVNWLDPWGLSVEVGYSKIIALGFSNVYHTFIKVTYQGQTKMRGFEASNILQKPFTILFGMNIPGEVRTETGGQEFGVVSRDPTQAMIVYNLVDSEQFNWTTYNYGTKNCFDWRNAVLIAADINPPNDLPWRK